MNPRTHKRSPARYLRSMDDNTRQAVQSFRAAGADFLRTELETAIMLCETALVSRDSSHAPRDVDHARRALEVVARFKDRVRLDEIEQQDVAEKTSRLEELIEQLNARHKSA
jgi:hypothetical protein